MLDAPNNTGELTLSWGGTEIAHITTGLCPLRRPRGDAGHSEKSALNSTFPSSLSLEMPLRCGFPAEASGQGA
jgi:hypothetical protein